MTLNEWPIPHDITLIITSSVVGFVSSLVLAWIKLRRNGFTTANAAEVMDRGKFREHLMERIDKLETKLDESEDEVRAGLERERELHAQIDRFKQ